MQRHSGEAAKLLSAKSVSFRFRPSEVQPAFGFVRRNRKLFNDSGIYLHGSVRDDCQH